VSSVKDVKYNDRTKYNDLVRDRYQTNYINKIIPIMINKNQQFINKFLYKGSKNPVL